MEMQDYKKTLGIAKEAEQWLGVYERLHDAGIPYRDVHYYRYGQPYTFSGYTMGEVIVVKCNGIEIDRIDQTKEYSKGCKWKAKHGIIYLDFTAKGLKDYIKAVKNNDYEAKRSLVRKYIDLESSEITKQRRNEMA